MKTIVLYWIVCLLLIACADERHDEVSSTPVPDTRSAFDKPVSNIAGHDWPASVTPPAPTRSELRVMAEKNRDIEARAHELMRRFSEHLDDEQQRKALQAEFKRLLPAYKANMLQLGKARLRHETVQ